MHALITGASSGIGEALAKALASAGYDLTLVARRQQELERLVSTLPNGSRAAVLPFDLSRVSDLESVLEGAEHGLGPIDVLVNNAGMGMVAHTHEVPEADANRLLAVNLLTPLRLMRLVLPKMIQRERGAIVNMASVSALAPTPYSFYYNASKAGLTAASESLWAEAKRHGVHVLTVYPGPIKTAMLEESMSKLPKDMPRTIEGTPDELAERIVRAMKAKGRRIVYPRPYAVTRMIPTVARWAIDRFFPDISNSAL